MSLQLIRAIEKGNLDTVRRLIADGADPNFRLKSNGNTPLLAAITSDDPEALVPLLLNTGADVHQRSQPYEESLLTVAAYDDSVVVIDALLAAGAEVDAVDNDFARTPLMIAAREGNASVIRRLLEAGADPARTDKRGDTAYALANPNGRRALSAAGAEVQRTPLELPTIPWPEINTEVPLADPVSAVWAYGMACYRRATGVKTIDDTLQDMDFEESQGPEAMALWRQRSAALQPKQEIIDAFCTVRKRAYTDESVPYPYDHAPEDHLVSVTFASPKKVDVIVRMSASRSPRSCYEYLVTVKHAHNEWRIDSKQERTAGLETWNRSIL